MPKQQTENLVQLIASLNKAEKRFFKVFVKRNSSGDDILFLKLFDVIDKAKEYDEELILRKVPSIKKSQISNLKAHLYKQLLLSLRLFHRTQNEHISLSEQLDYAHVLYDKGHYLQALEILSKLKKKVLEKEKSTLLLQIVDFEKHIETQYITHSIGDRASELATSSIALCDEITLTQRLSNLSLLLYGLYLKVGYVRNDQDYQQVTEFFKKNLPEVEEKKLGFFQRLYLYQSYAWYYFVVQEFTYYFRYSQKWVDLFHEYPEKQDIESALYVKSLHNLLNSHFLTGQYNRLVDSLEELDHIPDRINLDRNTTGLLHMFKLIHHINKHYLDGTFTEGLDLVPELTDIITENPYNWDEHRVMVFNYKIACLYFGSGDFSTTITYLNKIINRINPNFREDIQCFARILNLIAHYELGNQQLVEYQVKSVYRFLMRMGDYHKVQSEILRFIRSLTRILPSEVDRELSKLKIKLEELSNDNFEKRPFLYLDIISWIEGKLSGHTAEKIIRDKFLEKTNQSKSD